mgnify:FL=1|jgi:F-type H+-transporting ATPase subunit delta|tara:strand:- start:629 stop:1165 length:537 start_codon:yes stop_codon:yes gene_type:complete
MIELTPLARPYAKAVFASALDTESIDEIKEELKTMALVSSTTEVKSLIEDPTLSNNEILNSLKTLLDGSISKTSQSLLNVLAENNRFNLLEAIFEIYKEIVAKHKEQKSVEVFVATEPSSDTEEKIKTRLVSTYGEGTNVEFKIDPHIMGGLSIKVGDETLDLSVKGKVKKLINQLNF